MQNLSKNWETHPNHPGAEGFLPSQLPGYFTRGSEEFFLGSVCKEDLQNKIKR